MMLYSLARLLARPAVTDWLIQRAQRTPYFHLTGDDGSVYMERYWLFNAYQAHSDSSGRRWGEWLPSIRLHRIMREDRGQHLHDHPWNARTFILRGWYREVRREVPYAVWRDFTFTNRPYQRNAGDTASLKFGQFHHIEAVSPGGVWTLFITWRKRGTWGFLVDGVKVPWRTHLRIDNEEKQTPAESSSS